MLIDYSISLGNILEVSAIIGGGLLVIVRQTVTLGFMKKELEAMQSEIQKIAAIITDNSLINQKIAYLEEDIREMKRGRGFVSELAGQYSRHGKIGPKTGD